MTFHEGLALVVLLSIGGVLWWGYKVRNVEDMVRQAWTVFFVVWGGLGVFYYVAWWITGRPPA